MAETHDVHVVCRKQSERRADASPETKAVRHEIDVGQIPVLSGLLFFIASTIYTLALALRNRYDIVYAFQNELIQGWVGSKAAGGRFVADLQSVPVRQGRDFTRETEIDRGLRRRLSLALYSWYEQITGRLLESASVVFCLTDGIRSVTEDAYDIDLADAYVFGMGIDTEAFTANACVADDRSDTGLITLTYVGTIRDARGLDHVIEAVAKTDRDVQLRIAGSGPDDHVAALKRKTRRLGVADRIEWLGLIPHEEVPELLHSTDIALSPLRDIESYRISFPAKLLEYMAVGCIVVATDIPPHRRLIEDGRNGFLYDGTADGFLRTVNRCLTGECNRDRIVEEARRTANQREWDSIVRKHEAVIFEE
jgi:glycosyltransferase involved in cell wall biosynthesis